MIREVMAKDITTGVLVRSDEVAWATLKQVKAGIECVADGGDESSLDVLLPYLVDPVLRSDAYYALNKISKRTNSLALAALKQNEFNN